jgi:hypothetical protein
MDAMVSRNQLKDRYRQLMDKVGEAAVRSGRKPSDILTVVVTKSASPDQVRQLMELGHQDLGENRVQQLQQRIAMTEEFLSRAKMMGGKPGMATSVRWHMIGHLQRNKVKPLIGLVKLVHSVDSLRLAEEIQAQASRLDKEVDVLLQVNVAEEPQKFGLAPPAVAHLAEQIGTMLHLRLRGLMVMAPNTENTDEVRTVFMRAKEMFNEMHASDLYGEQFNILSMGMSQDYEIAIECGANMIRVGRAVFGEPAEESEAAD